MVSIQCLSPANTNHLFKQLWYLFENKRSASIFPRQSNKFSWLQDKFRKFCPTMACGSVFFFFVYFCNMGRNDWYLLWKVPVLHLAKKKKKGNKKIRQTGNGIRGLPGAAYLLLLFPCPCFEFSHSAALGVILCIDLGGGWQVEIWENSI